VCVCVCLFGTPKGVTRKTRMATDNCSSPKTGHQRDDNSGDLAPKESERTETILSPCEAEFLECQSTTEPSDRVGELCVCVCVCVCVMCVCGRVCVCVVCLCVCV